MTDAHNPKLLSEADAAADLAGVSQLVSTMEAQALAAMLIVHAGDHKDVAYSCDMNPVHTLNWKHYETSLSASKTLLTLVSERDALAARVAELETEVLDQCRLNGMGSERELALMGRVAELEAALKPNLFWNDADPEHGETSIFEVIDSEWNGGCMKHGDEMVIQQAVRLPNIRVRLVPCPTDGDDYFDYEAIDAALSTTPESKP